MFPVAINAMSPTDLEAMLHYRWTVAGGKHIPFEETDTEFYKTLFAFTKGLPRDAIKVCDEVLRELAYSSRHTATHEDIEKIAMELNLKS